MIKSIIKEIFKDIPKFIITISFLIISISIAYFVLNYDYSNLYFLGSAGIGVGVR